MKRGKWLVAVGLILLLVSLLAAVGGGLLTRRADARAAALTAAVTDVLPPASAGVVYPPADSMPALELEGEDLVGLLSIPDFGVTLPIGEGWDAWGVHAYPRCLAGTVGDGTLIVGGADRPAQLGCLDAVEVGTTVTVTDMTGAVYTFAVERVERSATATKEELTDPATHLTLFMRDTYSMEYVVAFCTAA